MKELNSLDSRRGRRALDVNNVIYWFKNTRAAVKRTEMKNRHMQAQQQQLGEPGKEYIYRVMQENRSVIRKHQASFNEEFLVHDLIVTDIGTLFTSLKHV